MPATLWCQARITVATVRWKVRLVGQFRWLAWSGSRLQPTLPLTLLTTGWLLSARFAGCPGSPPGSGSPAILRSMLPKRSRVSCPSASSSQ